MVHPLSVVCRSVVWFAVLLVSSNGRVAGFGKVWRSLANFVWRGLSDTTKFGKFCVAWSDDAMFWSVTVFPTPSAKRPCERPVQVPVSSDSVL